MEIFAFQYKNGNRNTDHLRNIRLSYAKDPQTGNLKILDESHYYPFGLKHQEYQASSFTTSPIQGIIIAPVANNPYKYKYNGKEWQDELGLNFYDYGARNYDPTIGRWMNIDPLTEQSRRWTPYNYAYNNPLRFIDPDGMKVDDIIKINRNEDGKWEITSVELTECDDPPCKKPSKIAIDPGHGIQGNNNPAMDRGTSGNGLKESDLTLTISEYVNFFLQSFGEETTMIREGELIVEGNSLIYRTNKAKKEGADIFVSIHINAIANGNASGFTVLYKNNGNYKKQNKALAKSISDNQKLMSVRGNGLTVRNDLMVLNSFSSTGPAVLVEVGFITNSSDANLMSKYPNVIARDIAVGIYLFLVNNP